MKNRNFVLLAVLLVITSSIAVYSADAAGIPKKAISTVARFLESDLPTTTVFTDTANTFAGANTFSHNTNTFTASNTGLVVSNPAATNAYTIAGGAITANRTLNLPVITGSDTLATLGLSQTFTGNPVIVNSLQLGGDANANNHKITSLAVPTQSTDAARSDQLGLIGSIPTTACSNGQVLVYNSGTSSWSCGFARTLLGSTTLGSAANSMTVSFTPGSFSKIEFEIYIPSVSGGTSTISMQFNGDTAANYAWEKLTSTGTTTASTTLASASACLLETTASSVGRNFHAYEFNTPTNVIQNTRWEGSVVAAAVSTAPVIVQGTCVWAGNAQITSVTVFTTTTTRNFASGSYVNVYGS